MTGKNTKPKPYKKKKKTKDIEPEQVPLTEKQTERFITDIFLGVSDSAVSIDKFTNIFGGKNSLDSQIMDASDLLQYMEVKDKEKALGDLLDCMFRIFIIANQQRLPLPHAVFSRLKFHLQAWDLENESSVSKE